MFAYGVFIVSLVGNKFQRELFSIIGVIEDEEGWHYANPLSLDSPEFRYEEAITSSLASR